MIVCPASPRCVWGSALMLLIGIRAACVYTLLTSRGTSYLNGPHSGGPPARVYAKHYFFERIWISNVASTIFYLYVQCVFVYIHVRARQPKRIGIRCTGSDGGDTRFENPRAWATVIITVAVRGGPTVADYRLDENNFYLYTMLLNYNTYMYALVCI